MALFSKNKNYFFLGISILVGLLIWFSPEPEGVMPQAWHLFAIFVATILGVILKPFPMGVVSIFSLMAVTFTGTLETTLFGLSYLLFLLPEVLFPRDWAAGLLTM